MRAKKGFDGVPVALVLTFVVLVIAATIGAKIISAVKTTMLDGGVATNESNVAGKGLDAFANYGALLPVVGTVLAAMLVIGLVLGIGAMRQ
jgi:hypothetical protein